MNSSADVTSDFLFLRVERAKPDVFAVVKVVLILTLTALGNFETHKVWYSKGSLCRHLVPFETFYTIFFNHITLITKFF